MTETLIANLIAAVALVVLLVAVCRAAYVVAAGRIERTSDAEPRVPEAERRAA
jgi:hypothetical protein